MDDNWKNIENVFLLLYTWTATVATTGDGDRKVMMDGSHRGNVPFAFSL